MSSTSQLRLEALWSPDGSKNGEIEITLHNLSELDLTRATLVYTALSRFEHGANVENAIFLTREANYHEFALPKGATLTPGESWTFSCTQLVYPGRHRGDGPKSAWMKLPDGSTLPIAIGELLQKRPTGSRELRDLSGAGDAPFAMLPWPSDVEITGAHDKAPTFLCAADGMELEDKRQFAAIAALANRLFFTDEPLFRIARRPGSVAVSIVRNADIGAEAYKLEFTEKQVKLCAGDDDGIRWGLISLGQLLRGAKTEPNLHVFPAGGTISDAPRYSWRGMHLDVSRQYYPMERVSTFVDILAWNKINRFHWHLTDDEGWRIEIKAFPELVEVGAYMGEGLPLVPQLGGHAARSGGYYTQQATKTLIDQALSLGVVIVPEIDIPGHCTAVLKALPNLTDRGDNSAAYSVQGYRNNGLNPGLDATYAFLETMLGEIADLFPSKWIHVGGDEVAHDSWMASSAAKELMQREGLENTPQMQAYLLRRVQDMLSAKGKITAGWEEVAHGQGIDPSKALLVAWTKPEVGVELARQGYDVVMAPGQAYYLDMVQSEGWNEPGLSWAGTVPPKLCYEYEAVGEFPEDLQHKLLGIQGCIWSENLVSVKMFNHLVFPRLSAIAESAWTQGDRKEWSRFARLMTQMPEV